ncbi:MAG: SGNH/GDSL hydrolase family protein [Planctomycetota bacterium]
MIPANSLVLFQGDSITDAGRSRDGADPNRPAGLGHGYVTQIAARLLAARPKDTLRILNRGVSGDRVTNLLARWKSDAIILAPDVISILVGVNDTVHEITKQTGVEPEMFERVYRMLLAYTREKLPVVKLVLCEPFLLKTGPVEDAWLPELARRRASVKKLAAEFGAVFVPLQAAFDAALAKAPPAYWAPDGVHPSPSGYAVMADAWLAAMEEKA